MRSGPFFHLGLTIQAVFFSLLALTSLSGGPTSSTAWAEEPPETPLADIEVSRLTFTVEKKSTNGRVLLLTTQDQALAPALRQLILIKSEGLPAAALRVLKIFDAQDLGQNAARFAAQRVRDYNPQFNLELGTTYSGILKVRDLELEQLNQSEPPKEPKDLNEASEGKPKEAEALPPEERSAKEITEAEERELKILAYEEPPNFEPYRNGLGLQAALIKIADYTPGQFTYVQAAGLRYSRTVWLPVRFNSRHWQDSLSFDVSALLTKTLEYAEAGDSYTVMPIQVLGRYNVNFGETASIFGYAGVMKGFVLASVTSGAGSVDTDQALSQLGLVQPALGIGGLFRVGPQWYVRVELGIEQASGGLVLKF